MNLPPTGAPLDPNSLEAQDWFHGQISREEAEGILEEDGEFLVRESTTQAGQYVLTGMENGQVKHLLLVDPEGVVSKRTGDGVCLLLAITCVYVCISMTTIRIFLQLHNPAAAYV